MKLLSGLFLSLVMSLTSVTMAVAHAQSAGAMQLELCDAHGGTATITVDAAGNPIAPPHHCPDCLAAVPALPPLATDAPARPLTRSERQVCALPITVDDPATPEPAARGPPPLL